MKRVLNFMRNPKLAHVFVYFLKQRESNNQVSVNKTKQMLKSVNATIFIMFNDLKL